MSRKSTQTLKGVGINYPLENVRVDPYQLKEVQNPFSNRY